MLLLLWLSSPHWNAFWFLNFCFCDLFCNTITSTECVCMLQIRWIQKIIFLCLLSGYMLNLVTARLALAVLTFLYMLVIDFLFLESWLILSYAMPIQSFLDILFLANTFWFYDSLIWSRESFSGCTKDLNLILKIAFILHSHRKEKVTKILSKG